MVEILSECVKTQLPSLKSYLDSRLIETSQTKEIKRALINSHSDGLTTADITFDKDHVLSQIADKPEYGEVESNVKVHLLDIPDVFEYDNPTA